MTLSGMGTVMDAKVRKLQGFDEWLGVATDSRCYTEIFDKGRKKGTGKFGKPLRNALSKEMKPQNARFALSEKKSPKRLCGTPWCR